MPIELREPTRLPREQCEAIMAYGARTTWPAGFTIYEKGAVADGVFLVLTGQVVLRNQMGVGRSFVPWVATAGETFGGEGLDGTGRYVSHARAETEAATLHLSTVRFSALLREQPSLALGLIRQLMAERTELLEKFGQHVTLTVEQRLIASLVRMAQDQRATERKNGPTVVPRRLLGELVGATRESISLVLGRLSAEGLIQREGNGLVITNPDRLRERLRTPAQAVGIEVFTDSAADQIAN
jgi:CRP/FNR family transcriptional regulator, cyclic AMP receptor protein